MSRGAGRKNIFRKGEHRQQFCALLEQISSLFQCEVYAYCLMGNHYHLLIHTPLGNLGRAMRHLNGVYTQRFNRKAFVSGTGNLGVMQRSLREGMRSLKTCRISH
jgi:putative transposase